MMTSETIRRLRELALEQQLVIEKLDCAIKANDSAYVEKLTGLLEDLQGAINDATK